MKIQERHLWHGTSGLVLHWAARYDVLAWLVLRGRERAFREKVLRLARVEQGESILDVGCGTGTLAIAAKRFAGPAANVCGVDPSREMIARATKKARKAGVDVTFQSGIAESRPFPDSQIDVVLVTLVLHHLPRKTRQEFAAEIRRVLKPGGRVLVVDFGAAEKKRKGLLSHLHRHGHVKLDEITALLNDAGLKLVEVGEVGILGLNFVLAGLGPKPNR